MKTRIQRTYDRSRGALERRWALEILEAIADGDSEKLLLALSTSAVEIDTQVQIPVSKGAPLNYGGMGK